MEGKENNGNEPVAATDTESAAPEETIETRIAKLQENIQSLSATIETMAASQKTLVADTANTLRTEFGNGIEDVKSKAFDLFTGAQQPPASATPPASPLDDCLTPLELITGGKKDAN